MATRYHIEEGGGGDLFYELLTIFFLIKNNWSLLFLRKLIGGSNEKLI